MKFTKKQFDQILEILQQQHSRGDIISAEVEYLLMIMFKNNIEIVNRILEKWNKEIKE